MVDGCALSRPRVPPDTAAFLSLGCMAINVSDQSGAVSRSIATKEVPPITGAARFKQVRGYLLTRSSPALIGPSFLSHAATLNRSISVISNR